MNNTLEEVKAILKKYNQEHLLNGYENLDERKQKQLLDQIMNIDFELVRSLYNNTKNAVTNNIYGDAPIFLAYLSIFLKRFSSIILDIFLPL